MPDSTPQSSKKTIKLKPLSTQEMSAEEREQETISFDRDALEAGLSSDQKAAAGAAPAPIKAKPVEVPTGAVPIQATPVQATPAPAVPGTKQTIKLRPSTGAAPSAPAAAPSATKQTIKLKPVDTSVEETVTEQKKAAVAPMAKQTIKLSPSSATTPGTPAPPVAATPVSPSKPTVKLTPSKPADAPSPSAPTAQAAAPPEPPPEPVEDDSAVAGTQTIERKSVSGGLKLKKTVSVASKKEPEPLDESGEASAAATPEPAFMEDVRDAEDEPGIAFSVMSWVSLVAMLILAFALFAQWGIEWNDMKMSVPVFSAKQK